MVWRIRLQYPSESRPVRTYRSRVRHFDSKRPYFLEQVNLHFVNKKEPLKFDTSFCGSRPSWASGATLASRTRENIARILESIAGAARYCIGFGAHGHDSDCSSERRVVLTSGNFGWPAQCCQESEQEGMAAPECEREARKRRERHDSGCTHERKERRSLSEERMPPPPPPTPPLQDYNRLESERRAERLSRARRPQFGVKRRRPPVRVPKAKDNECFTREVIRCSTPPNFDYAVVLRPTVTDEPEPLTLTPAIRDIDSAVDDFAADEATLAAELSAAEKTRRDERNAHNSRREQPCPDRRLEKISKKIIVLKKSIANYEADYEAQNGQPLTPSDRITDVQLTQMYENLRQLQAEKRCIKTDPVDYALKLQAAKAQKERDDKLDAALKSNKSMVDVVTDIEEVSGDCSSEAGASTLLKPGPGIVTLTFLKSLDQEQLQQLTKILSTHRPSNSVFIFYEWLEGCRQASGRASSPESNWSSSQLAAEKSCVQRALLRLEAARGRPPAHSADRGAARHLYERYRTVKRVLATSRPDLGNNNELATILEHEAMLFNTSVDSSSDSNEKPSDNSAVTTETLIPSPPTRETAEEVPSSTSSAQSAASEEAAKPNEGLHCLSLDELNKALFEAKMLKFTLRRSIKEYENNFEVTHSRKLQRDDKKGREEEYIRYKTIKARIKLINVLINKQKALAKTSTN